MSFYNCLKNLDHWSNDQKFIYNKIFGHKTSDLQYIIGVVYYSSYVFKKKFILQDDEEQKTFTIKCNCSSESKCTSCITLRYTTDTFTFDSISVSGQHDHDYEIGSKYTQRRNIVVCTKKRFNESYIKFIQEKEFKVKKRNTGEKKQNKKHRKK